MLASISRLPTLKMGIASAVVLMAVFLGANAYFLSENAHQMIDIEDANRLNLPKLVMEIATSLWSLNAMVDHGDAVHIGDSLRPQMDALEEKLSLLQATTVAMGEGPTLADDFKSISSALLRLNGTETILMGAIFEDISSHFRRVALWVLEKNQDNTAAIIDRLRLRQRYARFSALAFVLTGCLTVFFLIIDMKRRDELLMKARQAERMKSSFFAMMSHEIRTPLNGVLGTLALLEDTLLNPEQLYLLQTTRASAENLLGIVNDVLDYSKIEAAKLDIEYADFSLREMLTHVMVLIAPLAQEKGLSLSHTVTASLPDAIHSDPVRVRQILLNFLSNAVKFTDKGFIHLDVRKESSLREGEPEESVRFEVTDSGIGITPEARRLLFREFSQVDGSSTRRFAGTGLGLAISARLAAMMGGTIGVISEKDKGSTFWFSVPLAPARAALPDKAAEACGLGGRTAHILLAEDNATNQMITSAFLRKAGHNVDIANNGEEALHKAKENLYDLVLMDVSMPVMDGLAATRAIRGLGERWKHIPILALTAHALRGDRDECLQAGMNGYVAKPTTREALLQAVSHWTSTPVDPILSCSEALASPLHNPDGSKVIAEPVFCGELTDVFPPAACVSPALSVLRHDMLIRLIDDLGAEGIKLFAPAFRDDVRKHGELMLEAANNQDWPMVQLHAHSLRSAVLSFGLEPLSLLAGEIENACKTDGKADTACLSKWPEEFDAAFAALKTKLESLGLAAL